MKRKALRFMSLAVVCVLLFGMLAGCGEKGDDGKVVITLGNVFPNKDTQPEQYEMVMEKVRAFEKEYPNVKVEDANWNFDVKSYLTKAAGGTLPTAYEVPITETAKIMELGYAADLTQEFKDRGFYDQVTSFALDGISSDGKVYFVPTRIGYNGLIVNLDIYEKAGFVDEDGTPYQPTSWEDLARVAKEVTEKTGVPGFLFPTTGNIGGWRITPMAWSYGVNFMEKENGKWTAKFDCEEMVEMFELIHDMKWKDNSLPATTLVDYGKATEIFASGGAAMTFGDSDMVQSAIRFNGAKKDNIGMLAMPAGTNRQVTLIGGAYSVIDRNATKEQIKAVLDWYEFTGTTVKLTDVVKENLQKEVDTIKGYDGIVGLRRISPWKSDCPVTKYEQELYEKNMNINPNHIKHYNETENIELQAEEPVEAQALYSVLDSVIQEVLTNENADIRAAVSKAASDFQKNQLDYAE